MAGIVSFMNMALELILALILLPGPCRAGKNWECINAGLIYFNRAATSRVSRKYGSWSMAQGIRDCICVFFFGSVPKIWGKVEEKAVAACIEAKWSFPMLSLYIQDGQAYFIEIKLGSKHVHICEAKSSLTLISSYTS